MWPVIEGLEQLLVALQQRMCPAVLPREAFFNSQFILAPFRAPGLAHLLQVLI